MSRGRGKEVSCSTILLTHFIFFPSQGWVVAYQKSYQFLRHPLQSRSSFFFSLSSAALLCGFAVCNLGLLFGRIRYSLLSNPITSGTAVPIRFAPGQPDKRLSISAQVHHCAQHAQLKHLETHTFQSEWSIFKTVITFFSPRLISLIQ